MTVAPEIAFGVLALIVIMAVVLGRTRLSSRPGEISIHVSLDRIRQVGELAVLTAYIKEVVTMTSGAQSKFSSTGRILLICGFDIEFRYDLRKIKVGQALQGGAPQIVLPPHVIRTIPRETEFYDERKSSFLGMFPMDFSVEERNKLLHEAREKAVEQAGLLQGDLQDKVRASAKATLSALAEAFGAPKVTFVFEESASVVRQLNEQLSRPAA